MLDFDATTFKVTVFLLGLVIMILVIFYLLFSKEHE